MKSKDENADFKAKKQEAKQVRVEEEGTNFRTSLSLTSDIWRRKQAFSRLKKETSR